MMKRKSRALGMETLESRECMAVSVGWDGPGKGSATLTYTIGKAPSGISQTSVNSAIETALKAWSNVAQINFVKTATVGLNNSIDFSFRRLDGSGGTLAQAYFPKDVNPARIAGDVQFDSSERWEVGNAQGSRAFDLVLVAVHELGHALGLDHTNVASSVMAPSVSPSQQFRGLASSDVSAIRSLYATRTSAAATPSVSTSNVSQAANNASLNTATELNNPRIPNAWRPLWNWLRNVAPVHVERLHAAADSVVTKGTDGDSGADADAAIWDDWQSLVGCDKV